MSEIQTNQNAPMPAVAFGGNGLAPTDLNGAWKCAQLVASSGLAPKGIDTPAAILTAAAYGAELGLSFMASIQSIAVVNGRPAIWGDGLLALCEGSGELTEFEETFEGEGDNLTAICRAVRTRSNGVRKTTESFSVADAKKAGLWGKAGPWSAYPKRMLKMRARSFALRDLFADRLRGVRAYEEAIDLPEAEYTITNVEPMSVETPVLPPQPEPSLPLKKEKKKEEPAPLSTEEVASIVESIPPQEPAAKETARFILCPTGGRKPGKKVNAVTCPQLCDLTATCAAFKGVG